ncbi:hypothetical protein BDW67DRAFT_168127 [Aspergillus spinulosporus]
MPPLSQFLRLTSQKALCFFLIIPTARVWTCRCLLGNRWPSNDIWAKSTAQARPPDQDCLTGSYAASPVQPDDLFTARNGRVLPYNIVPLPIKSPF